MAVYSLLQFIFLQGAVLFKLWKIKHENTAWHGEKDDEDEVDLPDWDDIKGASHDAYLMNQRITSDTFRFKFLNYNRAWLINQLPTLLTPRTLRRSRPYLINQLARVIGNRRQDISDDRLVTYFYTTNCLHANEQLYSSSITLLSPLFTHPNPHLSRSLSFHSYVIVPSTILPYCSDDDQPKFDKVALTAPSRSLVRWWLAKARRRMRLKQIVEPIVSRARGAECEQCLSRKQLQVRGSKVTVAVRLISTTHIQTHNDKMTYFYPPPFILFYS